MSMLEPWEKILVSEYHTTGVKPQLKLIARSLGGTDCIELVFDGRAQVFA